MQLIVHSDCTGKRARYIDSYHSNIEKGKTIDGERKRIKKTFQRALFLAVYRYGSSPYMSTHCCVCVER